MCCGDAACGWSIGVPGIHYVLHEDGVVEKLHSAPRADQPCPKCVRDAGAPRRDVAVVRRSKADPDVEVFDPRSGTWVEVRA